MTNLLILSSHSILEYDDLRLFHRLGYDVFMPGGYSNPSKPGETMRPALPEVPYRAELDDLCQEQRERHAGQPTDHGIIDWAKADLHPMLIDWADIIMVNCFPESWIGGNWNRIREKRVIWRTIGQSSPLTEHEMKRFEGLEIVRYSPAEKRAFEPLGVFAGEDAMIRFGKDADDYGPWTGTINRIGNVSQNLDVRGDHCGLDFWREATAGLPTKPAGLGSERLPNGTGTLTFDMLRDYYRRIRCLLYMGTQPASYTLSLMEAMLTGTPTLSIGPDGMWMPRLFEGHELAPWTAQDAASARVWCQATLAHDPDAVGDTGVSPREESEHIRKRGIELFSYDVVGPQWVDFLGFPSTQSVEARLMGSAA